jgi:hypothetical protein
MKTLSQLALCFFLACTLISAPIQATQEKSRRLVKLTVPNEPVEIVKVTLDRRPLGLDEAFMGDDEWVKGLIFTVRNTSSKPIAYIGIAVDIPLTGLPAPAGRIDVTYGGNPFVPGDHRGELKNVQPDQSVEIGFDVTTFTGMKQYVEKQGGSMVTDKVTFIIEQIIFDDDSGWRQGQPMCRDPKNPMNWKTIDDTKSPFTARTAQENSRRIVKYHTYADEPVEVVAITAGKRAIELEQAFPGDDDWIKTLTFTVRNTSQNAIAYLSLDLDIPLTGFSAPAMRLTLSHGVNPNLPVNAKGQVTGLQPGQSVDLAVDVATFDLLKNAVQSKGGHVATEKVSFTIGQIVFADDSGWAHGQPIRRDPKNNMK